MPIPFSFNLPEGWLEPRVFMERFEESLSPVMRTVMTGNGSLTEFFENVWRIPLEVRLERQSFVERSEAADEEWSELYRLPADGELLMRDAWLMVAGEKRLFAHSQVVVKGLPKSIRKSLKRGEQPLGAVFSQQAGRGVMREQLELGRGQSKKLAKRLNVPEDHLFWCRRSLLSVAGQVRGRIFEVFLRDL